MHFMKNVLLMESWILVNTLYFHYLLRKMTFPPAENGSQTLCHSNILSRRRGNPHFSYFHWKSLKSWKSLETIWHHWISGIWAPQRAPWASQNVGNQWFSRNCGGACIILWSAFFSFLLIKPVVSVTFSLPKWSILDQILTPLRAGEGTARAQFSFRLMIFAP